MPYPPFLTKLPDVLKPMDAPAGEDELTIANGIRDRYQFPGGPKAYMVDIVRAFRVAKGARTYIEVGTRDKGNIAWLIGILAHNATIIDVDLEQVPSAQKLLESEIGPAQNVHYVEGNSVGDASIAEVKRLLDGRLADVIFLDSSHMYDHFLIELGLYWEFLKPGGIMLWHDAFWEGNENNKGKAQAGEAIDRHHPVYVVSKNEPVSRYHLRSNQRVPSWGGVGVMVKPEE